MKREYNKISLGVLSNLFGYTRQNYYKRIEIFKRSKYTEGLILEKVKNIRIDQPKIGTIKLHYLINKQEGIAPFGRDKLYNLLRTNKMLVKRKKKYRPKLTNGDGTSIYPDLRKDNKVIKTNQLWCTDITYLNLTTKDKFAYLLLIVDEYSHLIVGYNIALNMRTKMVLQAMKKAVADQMKLNKFYPGLILHSDRGSQFKSKEFMQYIKSVEVISSMTKAGHSHENPVAERLNGIIKNELLFDKIFTSFEDAKFAVDKAVQIYNTKRPHLSCNMMTPQQAHICNQGPLKKLWKQRKYSNMT